MKLSEPNKLPRTNILYISDFSLGSPGVRSFMWPSHYKSIGKYWNWLFCYLNYIIRSQACIILLLTFDYIPQCPMFAQSTFYDVMHDVTGVILPYPSFSSITPYQIELERREGHQCVQNELLNPMVCNTTTLGQGNDLSTISVDQGKPILRCSSADRFPVTTFSRYSVVWTRRSSWRKTRMRSNDPCDVIHDVIESWLCKHRTLGYVINS